MVLEVEICRIGPKERVKTSLNGSKSLPRHQLARAFYFLSVRAWTLCSDLLDGVQHVEVRDLILLRVPIWIDQFSRVSRGFIK